MKPSHLPGPELFRTARAATETSPLRVLVSACLAGRPVGVDGSDYGPHDVVTGLLSSSRVRALPFCPEDLAFGTPRDWCDIHGGDGHDVLDGRARVISLNGEDWTEGMVAAARAMAAFGLRHDVQLALLMDVSAACGSQVVYLGSRFDQDPVYQAGAGVAAAAIMRAGIPVVSQRDFRTLEELYHCVGLEWRGPESPRDHHHHPWYREYFGGTT